MVRKHIFFSGQKTHSGKRPGPGRRLPLPLLLYRPVPWPGRLGGEPVGRKSGDGSAGKRSFHSGNVRSDSATEMDQRGGYGDHRDSL